LRVLRIALGRAEPTVSLSSRLDGTDHRIPGGTRQVKGSTAGGVARSTGPAATAPSASTSPASSPTASATGAASRRRHVGLEVAEGRRERVRECPEVAREVPTNVRELLACVLRRNIPNVANRMVPVWPVRHRRNSVRERLQPTGHLEIRDERDQRHVFVEEPDALLRARSREGLDSIAQPIEEPFPAGFLLRALFRRARHVVA